jgi:hypothetical protein
MRKVSFFFLLFLLLVQGLAFGQVDNAEPAPKDPTPLKVDKKIPVTGSEKFDFIFTRSAIIGKTEGVPFNIARSGTYSFGIGYGIPMGKSLEFKFEPRLLWQKMYFVGNPDKWFPSSDSNATLVFEKQRIAYFEVPVALKFKLARNLLDRYKLLFEVGFVFGRRIGSTYKTRHYTAVDSLTGELLNPKITVKTNHISDLAPFRYGPFLRIGTNWLSAYAFYRISDVFLPYRRYNNEDGTSRPYPNFSKLELGITIAI